MSDKVSATWHPFSGPTDPPAAAPLDTSEIGVRWLGDQGPVPTFGLCPHQCSHNIGRTVAFGPDNEHHRLVRCDAECKGRCRGWLAEYDPNTAARLRKPQVRPYGFRLVTP